jgi:predicted nucleic acid-binding protein
VIAFFDASALIYLIEGHEPFAQRVRDALRRLTERDPGTLAAVSRLSWLECRAGPLKQGDTAALELFDGFFARPDLLWVELDRQVVELATEIRVRHGMRTPDALQAACCLQLGPDHVMLTGDAAFQRVAGLRVFLLG